MSSLESSEMFWGLCVAYVHYIFFYILYGGETLEILGPDRK